MPCCSLYTCCVLSTDTSVSACVDGSLVDCLMLTVHVIVLLPKVSQINPLVVCLNNCFF